MLSALAGVLVLVADRAAGDQLAPEVGLHRLLSVALDSQDHLYTPLPKDVHRAAAHAAGNDHPSAVVRQEIGQEAGTVPRVAQNSPL